MENPARNENRGHTPPARIKTSGLGCPKKRWFFTGCLSFLVLLNQYGEGIITEDGAGIREKAVFRGFPGSLVENKEEQFRGDKDEIRVMSKK